MISLHHSYLAPDTLAEAYVLNFSYEGPDQQPRVGFTLGNDTVDVTLRSHQDMKKLFERLISLAGTHKIERPGNIVPPVCYAQLMPYRISGYRNAADI